MKKDLKGIFAVWKPKGPSSYDIIRELKRRITEKKIGHAGTLDPKASGILVIAVGRDATKRIADEVSKEKEYAASIRLGAESSTDDAEGIKRVTHGAKHPKMDIVRATLAKFVGTIMQVPPVYSALKVQGKTAYARTRAGEQVKLEPRAVIVKKIELVSYRWPYLKLKVVTGPGVYIRALARDIGKELGVGGYLAGLERTRVGEFTKKNAVKLAIRYKTPRRRQ